MCYYIKLTKKKPKKKENLNSSQRLSHARVFHIMYTNTHAFSFLSYNFFLPNQAKCLGIFPGRVSHIPLRSWMTVLYLLSTPYSLMLELFRASLILRIYFIAYKTYTQRYLYKIYKEPEIYTKLFLTKTI